MDKHNFQNTKKPVITPRKILLIGTLGSGKTTLAEHLAQDTGFPYTSIDECRIRYGDGTLYGEERAWDHFLEDCSRPAPGILEFSGMGPHMEEVRCALLASGILVSVLWIVLPLDTCITRALQRQKNIPAPFLWAPVEYSIPAIHAGVDCAWEYAWTREPSFHAVRREFSQATSPARIYSGIWKTLITDTKKC